MGVLWEQEDKRSPSKACLFFSVGDLVPGLGRAEALKPRPTLPPTCLLGALKQDVTDGETAWGRGKMEACGVQQTQGLPRQGLLLDSGTTPL